MPRSAHAVSAADLLATCGAACPADLPATRVLVRSAPPWLRIVWREPFAAIALPWGIYLRDGAWAAPPELLGKLLLHELVHADQWRRLGTVGFLRRYVAEYVRHRRQGMVHLDAYMAISLEVEARLRSGG